MIRRRSLVLPLLLILAAGSALGNPVEDKNFLLLSLIERTPAVARVLAADPDLAKLHQKRQWSDAEIAAAADALKRLYDNNDAVRELTDGALRHSRAYIRYDAKSGRELLAAAWIDAARGIDNIIDVYENGKPPRSPLIDSPSFDVKSDAYTRLLHTVASSVDE